MATSGCTGCNRVNLNYEGVLVSNYGRSWPEDFKVVSGSQGLLSHGTDLYQVPMFESQGDPAAIELTARDAGVFTVDPGYTYQAIRGKGKDIVYHYKHLGLTDENTILDNIESGILNKIVIDSYREEARNFTTDSLMNNLNKFEKNVFDTLKHKFEAKYFTINTLTSGLKPPASMSEAIERRNNAKQQAEQVKNELEVSKMNLEKAKIDAETNKARTEGLSEKNLTEKWIEAIRTTQNRVIITDGKTPVILSGN